MREIVQIKMRSQRSVEECLKEVIEIRPRIEKRYVYVGAVTNSALSTLLGSMIQQQRDKLLASAIKRVFIAEDLAVTKLGPDRFTLVGGEDFGKAMSQVKESLEQEVNDALHEATR